MRALLVLALASSAAAAADTNVEVSEVMSVDAEPRHLVYVDAFGRLGPYAVGYEYRLVGPLSIGVAGSAYTASGRRVVCGASYLGIDRAVVGRHGVFLQLGGLVVRESEPIVDLAATGFGAQLAGGYQWKSDRWLLRGQAVATAGARSANLWAGASVGVRF